MNGWQKPKSNKLRSYHRKKGLRSGRGGLRTYFILCWAAVLFSLTMLTVHLMPTSEGSSILVLKEKRKKDVVTEGKTSMVVNISMISGTNPVQRMMKDTKKKIRWFPHRLGFLNLLELDPEGELDAFSHLDAAEPGDSASVSSASVTEQLALEEIGAELLGTTMKTQILGFERDEEPSILVLAVQCKTKEMYYNKNACTRPIVAQSGRSTIGSLYIKLFSPERQGAGVGLRGAAENSLNQIQAHIRGERIFGSANSENLNVNAGGIEPVLIQADITVYVSRSENPEFQITTPTEIESVTLTKTRVDVWKQYECQLPQDFEVMKNAVGLELSTGLVMFTPIEVAAFNLVNTKTAKANLGNLLQHYVEVRLGLDMKALPSDFPDDDTLMKGAQCLLSYTRTFVLGREDSNEKSEKTNPLQSRTSSVQLKLSRIVDGKMPKPSLSCTKNNNLSGPSKSERSIAQYLETAAKYLFRSIDPQALMFVEEYDPAQNRNLWQKKPAYYHSGAVFVLLLAWEALDTMPSNPEALKLLEEILDQLISGIKLCPESTQEINVLGDDTQNLCFVDDSEMVTVEGNSLLAAAISKMMKLKNDSSRLHLTRGLMAWVMNMRNSKDIFPSKKMHFPSGEYRYDPSLRPIVSASYTILALISIIETPGHDDLIQHFKDTTFVLANSFNLVNKNSPFANTSDAPAQESLDHGYGLDYNLFASSSVVVLNKLKYFDLDIIQRMEPVYLNLTKVVERAVEQTVSLVFSEDLSVFFLKPEQVKGAIHSDSSFTVTLENMLRGILNYIAFLSCVAFR